MRTWQRSRIIARLILCGVAATAALAACGSSKQQPGGAGGEGGKSASGSGGKDGGADGGEDGGDAGKDAGPDDCDLLCATENMVCPMTKLGACKVACEEEKFGVLWCAAVANAGVKCLEQQPASSFMCDTKGQAQPNAGVCATEQMATQTCWYTGPPAGLPDLTMACTKLCANEAALSCADPNCVTNCENAIKPGPKCNGALAAVVACASTLTAADFQCSTTTPPKPGLKPGKCAFQSLILGECLK